MKETGFDGIPFSVKRDTGSGTYTDWDIAAVETSEMVPYSSIWITERIGYVPAVVTWRLWFHEKQHYYDFLTKLTSIGTLTILAGFQSLKGTQQTLGNPPRAYELLDNVKLLRVSRAVYAVDGTVEVDATFERLVDPVTRLAVVS